MAPRTYTNVRPEARWYMRGASPAPPGMPAGIESRHDAAKTPETNRMDRSGPVHLGLASTDLVRPYPSGVAASTLNLFLLPAGVPTA